MIGRHGQQGKSAGQGSRTGQAGPVGQVSPAIVTYIAEQLRAGYGEEALRRHLSEHGWPDGAITAAFDSYHQMVMPKPEPITAVARRYRPKIPKWTRARFIKLGVSFAVIAMLATGTYLLWPHKVPEQAAARVQLAYKQKQSRDIVLLAGVIKRFIDENDGRVPSRVLEADSGNLVLCEATCNPLTPEFARLTSYTAENVRFVSYASGMTAPDKDTMYVVSGGTCRTTTELGEQNVNPRAMVILYARLEDSGQLVQRCVTL